MSLAQACASLGPPSPASTPLPPGAVETPPMSLTTGAVEPPPPCLYHLGLYPDKLQPLFSICLWAGTLPAQQLELCPQAPSPGPIKQTGTLKPLKPTTSDHQATERLLSYPGLR